MSVISLNLVCKLLFKNILCFSITSDRPTTENTSKTYCYSFRNFATVGGLRIIIGNAASCQSYGQSGLEILVVPSESAP